MLWETTDYHSEMIPFHHAIVHDISKVLGINPEIYIQKPTSLFGLSFIVNVSL